MIAKIELVNRLIHRSPKVKIKAGNLEMLALFDTGAEVSLISEQIYNKIEDQSKGPIAKCNIKVAGVAGNQVETVGWTMLRLLVGNKLFEADFIVIPENTIKHDAILGIDFQSNNDIGIEMNQGYPWVTCRGRRLTKTINAKDDSPKTG